ncbi:MAG: MFS transporter [Chloroflexi bacterium]|nr:MFS transporter [Chloroflexota bacterium]
MMATFVQALFMSWGFYSWQPYFLGLLGQELTWVAGVIAALVALAMMVGNTLVGYFSRYCAKRTTLLLGTATVQMLAAIGVGLVDSFWLAVPLYLVVAITMGMWTPVKQAFLHQLIPSEQRATLLSLDSLLNSLGASIGQIGLGRISQTHSISLGYVLGGLSQVLVLPIIWALRQLHNPADRFEGIAGQRGACAAQGMPNTASVDTISRSPARTEAG